MLNMIEAQYFEKVCVLDSLYYDEFLRVWEQNKSRPKEDQKDEYEVPLKGIQRKRDGNLMTDDLTIHRFILYPLNIKEHWILLVSILTEINPKI